MARRDITAEFQALRSEVAKSVRHLYAIADDIETIALASMSGKKKHQPPQTTQVEASPLFLVARRLRLTADLLAAEAEADAPDSVSALSRNAVTIVALASAAAGSLLTGIGEGVGTQLYEQFHRNQVQAVESLADVDDSAFEVAQSQQRDLPRPIDVRRHPQPAAVHSATEPRTLVDNFVDLHASLTEAAIPHALGGAFALAYCTADPRGTIDIDLNVFVPPEESDRVLNALPDGVQCNDSDRESIVRDGQVRVWRGGIPIDLFFATHAFHDEVATRVAFVPFGSGALPVVACRDLAVFKLLFDRDKDRDDLRHMIDVHGDPKEFVESILGPITELVGPDDPRVRRLAAYEVGSSWPSLE